MLEAAGGSTEALAPAWDRFERDFVSAGFRSVGIGAWASLHFARFEREVIGERIRDKFAASRRKGMWMGGVPPLGYCVENRKLVVNETEAELVRLIFKRFLRVGSVTRLAQELRRGAYTTKSWVTQDGRPRQGKPIGPFEKPIALWADG